MVNTPILHVNGDHPEGEFVFALSCRQVCSDDGPTEEDVAKAMDIAFRYRNYFRKDIIVDLLVYRRWCAFYVDCRYARGF